MPFTKINNKDFKLENNRIVLSDEYKKSLKPKKITGSRFASVMGMNNFSTPVKTWSMMVNIYNEPMDKMIADAGNIIEPLIKNRVEELTNIQFKQYDPFKVQFDVFKEVSKIFGGIPDGEPVNIDGDVDYTVWPMLEIKTTSIDSFKYKKVGNLFELQKDELGHPIVKSKGTKKEKWFDSKGNVLVPDEYKMQLGLYCYLRNISKGLFAIAFLEREDYINPRKCNIKDREIQLVDFTVNLENFKPIIEEAEQWYSKFIETGVSPELSKEDLEWFMKELENEK